MALNDTAKNVMLDALVAVAVYASAHSADPGTTGLNEIAGGAPAYARKSVTWNAAATGSVTASNTPVIDVEGGDTVAWIGFWSALTSGTFYGSDAVTSETFGGQGTYTIDTTTISLT